MADDLDATAGGAGEEIAFGDVPIVGVGASAGGLAAFKRLLEAFGEAPGLAVVIVQHLSPDHESLMAELLERSGSLPVSEAQDGMRVEADNVYVIEPGKTLEIRSGRLRVDSLDPNQRTSGLVDRFFRSLAQERGAGAIGVLLSGTGSDGTAGLRAIHEAGGLAVAQDPDDAEHPGMPQSAIEAGAVDRIAPIEEVASVVHAYLRRPWPEGGQEPTPEDEAAYQQIMGFVRSRSSFDSSHYKRRTLERRVRRRAGLCDAPDLRSYLEELRDDREELDALVRDLRIGVTAFFRDSEAFEELRGAVVPELVGAAEEGGAVRVWVPGCATGEEAYSIAMCLLDEIERRQVDLDLQVFASDVDERALAIARTGIYSEGLVADVPLWARDRFFSPTDDGRFVVNKRVRQRISFAAHDVLRDPPFSQLDLLSCRNMLIYFQREAQREVLEAFHFALRPGGVLFLGSSESSMLGKERFEPISVQHRLYRRVGRRRRGALNLPGRKSRRRHEDDGRAARQEQQRESQLAGRAMSLLLSTFSEPAVVVDRNLRVRFVHGHVAPYLTVPPGETTDDLLAMLRKDLRTRVRSGLYKAQRDGEPVLLTGLDRDEAHPKGTLQIRIHPDGGDEEGLLGIVFGQRALPVGDAEVQAPAADATVVRHLEQELEATRQELRNTIEELETSNEELKSSNEEATTMNEELQSTNEELEATAEELRSLNEELATVNQELRAKIDEVEAAHDDLANFFSSTRLATLFLDSTLALKRYTPTATRLLGVREPDLGRPVREIVRGFDDALPDDARAVLEDLRPRERELQASDGSWYRRQVLPYRTEDDRIAGVVVTLTDVTQLKQASQELERRERQQAAVAWLGLEALHATGVSVDRLLHEAARVTADTLGTALGAVLEVGGEPRRYVLRAGVGWRPGLVGAAEVEDAEGSQVGLALRNKRPVVMSDARTEDRFVLSGVLEQHRVASGIVVPIATADGIWGALTVHGTEPRQFDDEDVHFVQGAANVVGSALQRLQAEQALRISEERFRLAARATRDGIWDADLATGQVWWNDAYDRMFGPRPQSTAQSGSWWRDRIHPDDRDRVVESLRDAIAGDRDAWSAEYRFRRANGRYARVLDRAMIARRSDGVAHRALGAMLDLSDLELSKEQLIESESRLRLALAGGRIGSWAWELGADEWDADARTCQLLGLEAGESCEAVDDWLRRIEPADVGLVRARLRSVARQGGEFTAEFRVASSGGRVRWLSARARVVHKHGTPWLGGVLLDITSRRETEQALRESDQRKDEFLAILGHELRNPLAAIANGVALLRRDAVSSDGRGWVEEMMTRQVKAMSSLVDDLLDLTRISRGRIELRKEHVSLGDAVARALDAVASSAEERHHQVHVAVPDGLYVHADPVRLEQVLSNLLSNAFRYTPEGGRVDILGEDMGRLVAIRVRDDGIGLEPAELRQIFEPFMQVREEGGPREGLGIGLTLVHRLVDLHGGRVEVRSEGRGRGSEFSVLLPSGELSGAAPEAGAKSTFLPSDCRVLVIDDNVEAATGLSMLLEGMGCTVAGAHRGRDGLALARSFAPDVVLLDIGLPDINGYQVANELRIGERGDRMRIIGVTGFGHQEARRRMEEAGFDDWLLKPVDLDELVERIRRGVAPDEPRLADSARDSVEP